MLGTIAKVAGGLVVGYLAGTVVGIGVITARETNRVIDTVDAVPEEDYTRTVDPDGRVYQFNRRT